MKTTETIRKSEIVSQAIADVKISKFETRLVVESVLNTIKNSLAEGKRIELRGLGSFAVVQRKPKKARNISRGTEVLVPARRSVKFKVSPDIVKKLNR